MGWSISMILVSEREPGYLGTFPTLEPTVSRKLIHHLDLGPVRTSAITTLERAFSLKAKWYCLGCYPGAAILLDVPQFYGCILRSETDVLRKLLTFYPNAHVLLTELASVTNYSAFALYQNGNLIRALAGEAGKGVLLNKGVVQPEERMFLKDANALDLPENGEGLVFAMTARFLGVPLDHYEQDKLTVEMIREDRRIWPFKD
jgi:hypothetical protein